MSKLVLLKNGDFFDEMELQFQILIATLSQRWIVLDQIRGKINDSGCDCDRTFLFDTIESLFHMGYLTRDWMNQSNCYGYMITKDGVSKQIFLIEYFKSLRAHQQKASGNGQSGLGFAET
jgi:hypothetical protein